MPDSCENAIYSEEYEDYIVEYPGRPEYIRDRYGTDCYQIVSNHFAIVYIKSSEVNASWRNNLLTNPRCFGLLSSEETLEETGIARVQRQPNLELYGSNVLLGIIDTGDGVR